MKLPATMPTMPVIVVDTREQNPVRFRDCPSERGTLTTGDYGLKAMPQLCAVERKSESDFLSCVGVERERFDREVMRLLAFPVRALVIESTWARIEAGDWRSKITPAAAMGSLVGWIAMGLPVVMAGDHERAGKFIERILFTAARREYRKLRSLINDMEKSQ